MQLSHIEIILPSLLFTLHTDTHIYVHCIHTQTHILTHTRTYIYIYYIYIYIHIQINIYILYIFNLFQPLVVATMKRLITKCHIPSIQKSKTLKIKSSLIFWIRYEMTEDDCI